jgi:hypothetical protein
MGSAGGGGGLDSSTTAWISAVNSHGGTVSAGRKTVVDNLITTLKSNGLWATVDRIWLTAAENAPSALTDLVAGALATAHNGGSLTFTADRGYQDTTNPTSGSYIDSGFNPATAPSPHFVTDAGYLFGWTNSAGADVGALVGQGSAIAAGFSRLNTNNASVMYWDLNSVDTTGGSSIPAPAVTGLYLLNRRAGTGAQSVDVNGAVYGSNTITSTGPLSANFTGLAGGVPSVYSTSQICAFGFGGPGQSGVNRTAFYNAMRTYMTAVGVP